MGTGSFSPLLTLQRYGQGLSLDGGGSFPVKSLTGFTQYLSDPLQSAEEDGCRFARDEADSPVSGMYSPRGFLHRPSSLQAHCYSQPQPLRYTWV